MTLEITVDDAFGVLSIVPGEGEHLLGLFLTNLHDQPPSWPQKSRRLRHNPAHRIQTIRTRFKGQPRLMVADIRRQARHLIRTHVGRVGCDDVKARRGIHSGKQITLRERDAVLGPEGDGILFGNHERLPRDIGERHLGEGALKGDRDADAAAARAQVQHAEAIFARRQREERALHDQLRFGPRDQHVAVHGKGAPKKLAAPADVRHGLPAPAPLNALAHQGQLAVAERPFEIHVQAHAIDPEHVRQDQLTVEARTFDAPTSEIVGHPGEHSAAGPRLGHGAVLRETVDTINGGGPGRRGALTRRVTGRAPRLGPLWAAPNGVLFPRPCRMDLRVPHPLRTRLAVGALLAGCAALGSGCTERLDVSTERPVRGSLGAEVYRVLCERVAAEEKPGDVAGNAAREVCADAGNVDAADTPRLRALAERRERLVSALERTLPESLKDDLDAFVVELVPLYDPPKDALPRQTAEVAGVIASVLNDDAALRAIHRLGAREGYRPLRAALGLARPLLAYPDLSPFVTKALEVLGEGGSAHDEWKKLSEVLALEMASADPTPPPAEPVETTLSVGRSLLFQEDASFGTGTARLLAVRDRRGLARVNAPGGDLPAPFVDDDADGLADIAADGRFVNGSGVSFKAPSPFPLPGADSITRDESGRALIADGSTDTLYRYVNVDSTLLAGISREAIRWLDPKDMIVLDIAQGVPALLGPRATRTESFGASVYEFAGYDTAQGPLFDLVHALGTTFDRQETADLLAVFDVLLRDHEPAVAALIESGLLVDRAAETSGAALRQPNDLWDDMLKVAAWIAQEPGLMEGLLRAFADPRTSRVGEVYGQMALYRDRITYDRDDINASLADVEFTQPVDRSGPNRELNQSILQRSLAVIHDLNYAKLCNRPGAKLGAMINLFGQNVFVTLPDVYAECEIFEVKNQAKLYAQSVIGRAEFTIKERARQNLALLGFTDLDTLNERESGILGFTTRPTAQATARVVFTPPNEYLSALSGPSPTRDGASVASRHADSVFAWERVYHFDDGREPTTASFLDTMTPMLEAFDDYDNETVGKGLGPEPEVERFLFGELISALHLHWPSPTTNNTQESDPQAPFYARHDGGNTYEPLIAKLFIEGKLTMKVYDLMTALDDIEVRPGVDGITVLARATEALLDPERNSGLESRAGLATTADNTGEETLPVTPMYLILDALKGFDAAFAEAPTRHKRWLHARSETVDQLFAIETQSGEAAFANRRSLAALRIAVQFLLERIAQHGDAGDLADWSDGLAGRLEKSLGSALGVALVDFVDAVQADPEAKRHLNALTEYLLAETEGGDVFDTTLLSVADQLQIFEDAPNVAPLVHALSTAFAPDVREAVSGGGLPDTSASAIERTLELLRAIDELPQKDVLRQVLGNLVALDEGSGETPLEAMIDVLSEVHRAAPGTEAPFAEDDYSRLLERSHEFLTSDERGLERLYDVVQSRRRRP